MSDIVREIIGDDSHMLLCTHDMSADDTGGLCLGCLHRLTAITEAITEAIAQERERCARKLEANIDRIVRMVDNAFPGDNIFDALRDVVDEIRSG